MGHIILLAVCPQWSSDQPLYGMRRYKPSEDLLFNCALGERPCLTRSGILCQAEAELRIHGCAVGGSTARNLRGRVREEYQTWATPASHPLTAGLEFQLLSKKQLLRGAGGVYTRRNTLSDYVSYVVYPKIESSCKETPAKGRALVYHKNQIRPLL